jgi:hypothetical protein
MSSTPRPRRLEHLVATHATQRQSITETLIRALLGVWAGFLYWNDDDLMNSAAARSALYVMAALRKARQLEVGYTKAILDEYGIEHDLLDYDDIYPRSGVHPLEVYRRVALQYRYWFSRGWTEIQSEEAALERLRALAETDVRIAGRDTSADIYDRLTITGWRRILHPELSRSGPCGLCVVASTRVYRSGDLEEIHDKCVCGKLPIVDGIDPGADMNKEDLERIYEAAGGNSAEALKTVRVIVRHHGEIGPVLVKDGDHWRDYNDAGGSPYTPPSPAEYRSLLLKMKESIVGTIDRLELRLDDASPADRAAIQSALRYNRDFLAALERRMSLP